MLIVQLTRNTKAKRLGGGDAFGIATRFIADGSDT
jgi:hypothetical protein